MAVESKHSSIHLLNSPFGDWYHRLARSMRLTCSHCNQTMCKDCHQEVNSNHNRGHNRKRRGAGPPEVPGYEEWREQEVQRDHERSRREQEERLRREQERQERDWRRQQSHDAQQRIEIGGRGRDGSRERRRRD